MRFYSLIFISCIFSFQLFAQRQNKIDSLKLRLTNSKINLEKFDVLNHLWNELINNDVEQALKYSEEMIILGQQLKIDTIYSFGLERKAVSYAYLNKFDSSGVYFKKALKMYRANGDYSKMAGIQRNLGQDYNMIGNLDSAFYYYEKAEKNYKKVTDSVGLADIYNSQAIAYLMKGYFNLSLEKAIEGEKIYEKNHKHVDLNQNRMVIASIYSEMKDTLNAIAYYKKIEDYFREQQQKRQLFSTLHLLVGLQIPNPSLNDETKTLIDELIDLSTDLKDPSLIHNANESKANFYFQNNDFEKAKNSHIKLVESSFSRNDMYSFAENNKNLGKTYLALKNYDKAISALENAKNEAEKLNIESLRLEINKLLSQSYETKGNYKQSLLNFKEYKSLSDTIYNVQSTNRFSELQTIFETEKKETEIALQIEEIKTLNVQAENDKLTKTLYSIGMFSFLTIAGLLYFGFKQRLKKNKIEREKQEEIYRQEIEFKKKELASQTLHLVQKSTFIQELKENLEKIKQSPELFKVEFRRLVMLLKKESAEDKDWEVFKSYFSEVHNNFDHKIRAIAEDITEKEIRLASFLRMNLSTKEIASMLNVLPDSVLKSKYRLKKKLQLEREDDLTQFLNTL